MAKEVKIIEPVDKELLKAELNDKHFLRDTNHAGNKLYIVDNTCAPNVLREIGRLREISFRAGGGGTGKAMDLDAFDLDPAFYPGKTFTVRTHGKGDYIQKAKLNGQNLTRCWLDWNEIASGGKLELWLGPEPNKAWGLRDLQSPK